MVADPAKIPSLISSRSTAAISAAGTIRRQVGRFVALALCVYLVLMTSSIDSLATVVPSWWTVVAILLVAVPALGLVFSTWRPDDRCLTHAAVATAVAYALVVASFPFVWTGEKLNLSSGIWIAPIAGVVAVVMALAVSTPTAFGYLVVAVVSTRCINFAVREDAEAGRLVTDLAWGLCTAIVPFAIAVAALQAGRILDRVRTQSYEEAAAAAAKDSRDLERARFDAITHDRVMAVLLGAARSDLTPDLRNQATATLEKLDSLKSDTYGLAHFGLDETLSELREAAAAVDRSGAVQIDRSPESLTVTYPFEVVRSISSAMSEALHNSVRHAGSAARRSVTVTARVDLLEVVVADNGSGFDREAISEDRLGLALSIGGRMQYVPGCSVSIDTALGRGTRILLRWERAL
jgi:signal transduction histidine kinase